MKIPYCKWRHKR